MAKWKPEVILVKTTIRRKQVEIVEVDPVEWINWEFERSGHLDRFLHSILENVRQIRRSESTTQV